MKLRRLTIISLLCAFVAAAASVWAAGEFGPPIGSAFPDKNVRLGPKGALVLLSGSKTKLAELEEHRKIFDKLGVGIVTLNELSGRTAPSGWMTLNPKGAIVGKYFDEDAAYTSAAILVHQFGWTPPGPEPVEGKQLTATVAASNSSVAPGERIALTLDIDLPPNMHVYAPGVEGYIPIDWKMENSDAAEVHATAFPRAEKLYLKAIDETVPAYRNQFRLTRDMTILTADKLKAAIDNSGHFAVSGSLRYQACDDRVCYIPQTLRLRWDFEYQERGR